MKYTLKFIYIFMQDSMIGYFEFFGQTKQKKLCSAKWNFVEWNQSATLNIHLNEHEQKQRANKLTRISKATATERNT